VALSTVVLVTGGFFIARGSLLQKLVSTSVPVHLTNPKEGFDESTTKTQ
jgi:hypothetical protein